MLQLSGSREEEEEEEESPMGYGRPESAGPQLQHERKAAELLQYGQLQAEPDDENSDLLDTSDPRDSAASPEDLDDDENSGDNENVVTKTCTYQGCNETTSQVAKQRKPWMCKKHRNKMYKDKYKNKKKSDQAITCTSKLEVSMGGDPILHTSGLEETSDCTISLTKQKTGSVGDRPPRPTLLEQVLNQKRLSLLRSPEVVNFLQTQQQLLSRQAFEQRQSLPGSSP
uniref:Regulatory factor X associated protein n=1 Tax=Leptobrachium leishanense TaxID=445787 RepID=A0A8C5WM39_9ANUR